MIIDHKKYSKQQLFFISKINNIINNKLEHAVCYVYQLPHDFTVIVDKLIYLKAYLPIFIQLFKVQNSDTNYVLY